LKFYTAGYNVICREISVCLKSDKKKGNCRGKPICAHDCFGY